MSLDQINAARLGLDRFSELGIAVKRRSPETPRATIVYIHGLGESSLCFDALISDARLDAWQHLAIDLLGYGRSTWPERPFDLEQHAASIELLLDRLKIEQAILVGHSMGSVIALLLAERGRLDVPFLLDIEGNVTFDDCSFSGIASGQTLENWLENGYGDFIDHIHYLAEVGNDTADESKERARVMRAYGASAHFADPRTLYLDAVDLVRLSRTDELANRRAATGVPMVYFYGDPRGTGDRSLGQLHDAGIATRAFKPAGHWPFFDQHDDFVEAMVEVLEKHS